MNAQTRKITRRLSMVAWGSALLAVGVAMALEHKSDTTKPPKPESVSLTVDEKPIDRVGRFTTSFAPVVQRVTPSVVKVYTTTKVKGLEGFTGPGFPNDPSFRWFFGPNQGGSGMQRHSPVPREHGIGSGVIVTKDGYILTNNHVVDGAEQVRVALQDGREFTAKVVGTDPKTDVAVVKIDANNLPFLEMADSDKIQVGDVVLAIGNPFGIGQTVTLGIVSAKGRGNMGLDYEDFIQTDAAINPGNSGGALVDGEGRLVGINTAIISRTGGNQGIGFAIPTNLAKYVMESLVTSGHVTRGYLGVLIQNVTPELAKQFAVKEKGGALVGDVTPGSPAEKAGIKNGDVIVDFNGKPVADSRALKLQVAEAKPGTTVPLKLDRNGTTRTVEVTLKELTGSEELAKSNTNPSNDNGTLNGVTVGDLDGSARRDLNAPQVVKGAVITGVSPDSPAFEAGLRPGDVIQEINHQPVRSADDAVRLTEKPKDKVSLLRVWRNGASHYVVVDESQAG